MVSEKRTMTYIGKLVAIEQSYKKMLLGENLTYDEKSLLLASAICMLEEYDRDNTKKMFFELSYEIIARYSIFSEDYKPLYDFSINYGFFPIVDYILENCEGFEQSMMDVIDQMRVDMYKTDKYMPTIQQHNAYESILQNEGGDISFVAPTSFGKSELIVSHIKKIDTPTAKVAIIVPTKSLLMQTYKFIKENIDNKKIILHDQMFENEESFIAVLTQERALRLLEKHNTQFDYLYIDEAHNLFDKDSRNRLLARLIRLTRLKNRECEVLYFSPLIQNSNNLKVLGSTNNITEYKIENNIKIPTYFLFENNQASIYNRFFNIFYGLGESFSSAFDYVVKKSSDKNLLYVNAPKRMENVSLKFARYLPEIDSPAINEIISSIKRHVHPQFQMIPLIRRGIVYLHGKLPDYVKDYIEYKAAVTPEIKYIAANTVLLEGINLPISSLFILDAWGLKSNKLINLSGRVNRLNSIFVNNPNLSKLFPPIHFVSNADFNGSMENYVKRLRTTEIVDEIGNPFLENFDISKIGDENQEKIDKAIEEEELYFSDATSPESELYKKMVSLALNTHLDLNSMSVSNILANIRNALQSPTFKDKGIVYKVVEIFLKDAVITDYEIRRLRNESAAEYYQHYLSVMRRHSLQENIRYEFEYFKYRKNDSGDPYMYMGSSYGECSRPYDDESKQTYVNLWNKDDTQMINLAIIKLKIEDDFLSYKFNKFVELLHDYGLITDDEYNFTTYGTEDEKEIRLVKQGLPIHLVSKLTNDDQLTNLYFDENNIIHSKENFKSYYDKLDDFYKYQIDKYVYV